MSITSMSRKCFCRNIESSLVAIINWQDMTEMSINMIKYLTLHLGTDSSKWLISVYLVDIFKLFSHIFHSYSRVCIKGSSFGQSKQRARVAQ